MELVENENCPVEGLGLQLSLQTMLEQSVLQYFSSMSNYLL